MSRRRRLDLRWSAHQGHVCLRVNGWTADELTEMGGVEPAQLGRRLAVLPSGLVEAVAALAGLQPVAGRFVPDRDAICFIPRFPFVDGMSYALLGSPDTGESGSGPEVWTVQRPARADAPTTDVTAI